MFKKTWQAIFGNSKNEPQIKIGNTIDSLLESLKRRERLDSLVASFFEKGQYKEALNYSIECVDLDRQIGGERHPKFATSLNNLAVLYNLLGDNKASESLHKQALEIRREVLGEHHSDFAASLHSLAFLYDSLGEYAAAETLYKQAIEIQCKVLGENHPEFAATLSNLAKLYHSQANYLEAEPLFQRALEIRRAVLGEQHPHFAQSLSNLASLHQWRGDCLTAVTLYNQALEIYRINYGEQHPVFADILHNLALAYYYVLDNPAEVIPFYKRALEIRRIVLGEQHPEFAQSLNSLGGLYFVQGDFEAAEPLFQQALEIQRAILGEKHHRVASTLHNLASLNESLGNYVEAEYFYKQALEVMGEVLGEKHPDFSHTLRNYATMLAETDRAIEAFRMLENVLATDMQMIGQAFSMSSESQRAYFALFHQVNYILFLSLVSQFFSESSQAIRSAFSLVLRHKAIGAEALAMQRDSVFGGKYPELALKLQEITALKRQIANKTLAGSENEELQFHQQSLKEWNIRKEQLEAEIARQIPEMNIEQKFRSIDYQVVAMALPSDSILIEFIHLYIYPFKAVTEHRELGVKPARYFAFVIAAKEPDNLQMIDLGEAEPIDAIITTFRAAITDEEEGRGVRDLGNVLPATDSELYVEEGKKLRKILFDKLLDGIGGCKRLFISPDGDLTRLPFETLPMDDGEFLIDKYHLSYLSVGRDVLRFDAASSGEPTSPMIIADPDFDLAGKDLPQSNEQTSGRISRDFDRGNLHFTPLPGTKIEGENIAKMLDVKPLLATDALESSLKACQSPRILHIATHGFFLKDEKRDLNKDRRDLGMLEMSDNFGMGRFSASNLENPLLRSGLALAGVNTWLKDGALPKEAEDGILTAEDVSGLDLLATELVVLSACETGIGEVRIGEGVFGLRRAFVLAGAKTLVMSLWKVPDKQTQELMEIFYKKILKDKKPRSEALREAQLEIREKNPHPLYWGAFICQGNPNKLDYLDNQD